LVIAVSLYLLALGLGAVTGMRTMAAPTAVSLAARIGVLNVTGTWFAWLGYGWTPWILGLFAIAELILDQLPSTPSRKAPVGFGARLLAGMLAGGAICVSSASTIGGVVAGAVGAIVGTLAGYALRVRLAKTFGRDRPAALLEDAIAYLGAALIVSLLS
jgi:uncharacterized membrane protein